VYKKQTTFTAAQIEQVVKNLAGGDHKVEFKIRLLKHNQVVEGVRFTVSAINAMCRGKCGTKDDVCVVGMDARPKKARRRSKLCLG
jgi:hypothetical protein